MTSYVALLRGINVGGHAKVAMDDLRQLFTDLGHADVKTYIQSGNVVFRSTVEDASKLARGIESRIAADMNMTVTVMLRSEEEMAQIVAANPFLGSGADESKLHVTFLAAAPDAEATARLETPAGEPDELAIVGQEVYLHCPNDYGRTKLNNAYIHKHLGVAANDQRREDGDQAPRPRRWLKATGSGRAREALGEAAAAGEHPLEAYAVVALGGDAGDAECYGDDLHGHHVVPAVVSEE